MWKKLVSLNLALLMLFGMLPLSASAAPEDELTRGELCEYVVENFAIPMREYTQDEVPFSDVNLNGPYGRYIMACVEAGIVNGRSDSTFYPQDGITRAELARILWMAAELEENTNGQPPEDVEEQSWYFASVMTALNSGVMSTRGNGKFMPNTPASLSDIEPAIEQYFVNKLYLVDNTDPANKVITETLNLPAGAQVNLNGNFVIDGKTHYLATDSEGNNQLMSVSSASIAGMNTGSIDQTGAMWFGSNAVVGSTGSLMFTANNRRYAIPISVVLPSVGVYSSELGGAENFIGVERVAADTSQTVYILSTDPDAEFTLNDHVYDVISGQVTGDPTVELMNNGHGIRVDLRGLTIAEDPPFAHLAIHAKIGMDPAEVSLEVVPGVQGERYLYQSDTTETTIKPAMGVTSYFGLAQTAQSPNQELGGQGFVVKELLGDISEASVGWEWAEWENQLMLTFDAERVQAGARGTIVFAKGNLTYRLDVEVTLPMVGIYDGPRADANNFRGTHQATIYSNMPGSVDIVVNTTDYPNVRIENPQVRIDAPEGASSDAVRLMRDSNGAYVNVQADAFFHGEVTVTATINGNPYQFHLRYLNDNALYTWDDEEEIVFPVGQIRDIALFLSDGTRIDGDLRYTFTLSDPALGELFRPEEAPDVLAWNAGEATPGATGTIIAEDIIGKRRTIPVRVALPQVGLYDGPTTASNLLMTAWTDEPLVVNYKTGTRSVYIVTTVSRQDIVTFHDMRGDMPGDQLADYNTDVGVFTGGAAQRGEIAYAYVTLSPNVTSGLYRTGLFANATVGEDDLGLYFGNIVFTDGETVTTESGESTLGCGPDGGRRFMLFDPYGNLIDKSYTITPSGNIGTFQWVDGEDWDGNPVDMLEWVTPGIRPGASGSITLTKGSTRYTVPANVIAPDIGYYATSSKTNEGYLGWGGLTVDYMNEPAKRTVYIVTDVTGSNLAPTWKNVTSTNGENITVTPHITNDPGSYLEITLNPEVTSGTQEADITIDVFNGFRWEDGEVVTDGQGNPVADYWTFKGHIVFEDTHTHSMTKTEAVEATCTEPGSIEYYTCSICEKLFSDAAGENEIQQGDIVVAALGHDWADEYTSSQSGHYHVCTRCGEMQENEIGEHTFGSPVEKTADDGTKTEVTTCTVCGYSETKVVEVEVKTDSESLNENNNVVINAGSGSGSSGSGSGSETTETEPVASKVTLPATVIQDVAEAVADDTNDAEGVTIQLEGDTSVSYDQTALETISNAVDDHEEAAVAAAVAADPTITNPVTELTVETEVELVVEPADVKNETLSDDPTQDEAMKATVEAAQENETVENVQLIHVTLEITTTVTRNSDNATLGESTTEVENFGGGASTITVSYAKPENTDDKVVVVVRVETNGSTTQVSCTYDDETKTVSWVTPSHSYYMISTQDRPTPSGGVYVAPGDAEPESDELSCDRGDDCPLKDFSDLDPTAWYHNSVHYALDNGLMSGMGNGKFEPDGTTSRAMVVSILYRLDGGKGGSTPAGFTDVASDAWFAEAVNWAKSTGVVAGYPDGTFKPNDPVSREQLALLLYEYSSYKGYDVSASTDLSAKFTDADKVSGYAKTALQWANAAGIVSGKGNGVLDPKGSARRCEAATMLYSFCKLQAEK